MAESTGPSDDIETEMKKKMTFQGQLGSHRKIVSASARRIETLRASSTRIETRSDGEEREALLTMARHSSSIREVTSV